MAGDTSSVAGRTPVPSLRSEHGVAWKLHMQKQAKSAIRIALFCLFCNASCLLGRVMLWRSAALFYALPGLRRRLGGLVQLTDELGAAGEAARRAVRRGMRLEVCLEHVMLRSAPERRSADEVMLVSCVVRMRGRCLERSRLSHATLTTYCFFPRFKTTRLRLRLGVYQNRGRPGPAGGAVFMT